MNCKARRVKENWWRISRRGRQWVAEGLITQDPPGEEFDLFQVWLKVTEGFQQWKDMTFSSLWLLHREKIGTEQVWHRLQLEDYCTQESELAQAEGMAVDMERSSRTEETFLRYNTLEGLIDT